MTRLKQKKINWLMAKTPQGVVLPAIWLKNHGISHRLAWWYVRSGWLEHLDKKIYKKSGDTVKWPGIIYSIQQYLDLSVHIGGKTALQLLGRAHNIPITGLQQILLYVQQPCKLPQWVSSHNLCDERFVLVKKTLFNKKAQKIGLITQTIDNLDLRIATPERAILEVMQLVPQQETYQEAYDLMDNLDNLRPKVVQSLLENCNSIKAKRLFLHCAEHCNHPWMSDIKLDKIDLGSGKRKIAEGGHYDPKYKISTPRLDGDNDAVSYEL